MLRGGDVSNLEVGLGVCYLGFGSGIKVDVSKHFLSLEWGLEVGVGADGIMNILSNC